MNSNDREPSVDPRPLERPVRPNTDLTEIMERQCKRTLVKPGTIGHPDTIWHIDFGSYGNVTTRKDEADYAIELGAIVQEYKPVQPNAALSGAE